MSAMMFADSMLGASAEMMRPRPSDANTKNAADTARNPTLPRSGMRKNPRPTSAITIMSTNAEQRPRQELREHELGQPQRAHHHLLLRAQVALAHQRHRGLLHGDDHDDDHHEAGDQEVGRLALGVVPGSHTRFEPAELRGVEALPVGPLDEHLVAVRAG